MEQFWERIDRSGSAKACWPWMSGRRSGYGRVMDGDRTVYAHRFAFETYWNVRIPKGLCVLHSCDNPPCCNPAHLWIGTRTDNAKDRDAKGRTAAGKRHGAHTQPERRSIGDRHGMRRHPERHHTRLYPERHFARGERNGRAKLSELQVLGIMARCLMVVSRVQVAREFGISRTTVGDIYHGQKWEYLFRREQ